MGQPVSTVQGAFVALLGLVDAVVTPGQVSTADPSAWAFFSYAGIIALPTIAVAARRQWYWLPELALVAIEGWPGLSIEKDLTISHIVPIGMTYGVVALAGLILALRAKSIEGLGNLLDNTITGNRASEILDVGAGNDTIYGMAGDDIYR